MKKSNKILIGVFLLFFAITFYYAYNVARNIKPITIVQNEEAISPKTAIEVFDTIDARSFQYIATDGVPVTIDTGEWEVLLRTYEDLIQYCTVEVRNDTLFVAKDPLLSTNYGKWVRVFVKTPRLKGLAVYNGGEISCVNENTNVNPDHLTVWADNGSMTLPVNADKLDVHILTGANVILRGNVGRLNVTGAKSASSLYAYGLRTDTAYVQNSGSNSLHLHVDSYLDANLLNSRGYLAYRGHPKVVKRENSTGRVINVNRSIE